MPYSAYHSLTIEQIMAKVEKAYDREGALLCLRAHDFAARVHADQKRKSGEPYIIHPEYVASILTLTLDSLENSPIFSKAVPPANECF